MVRAQSPIQLTSTTTLRGEVSRRRHIIEKYSCYASAARHVNTVLEATAKYVADPKVKARESKHELIISVIVLDYVRNDRFELYLYSI